MPKLAYPELPIPVPYTDDDIVVSFSELDTYRQCPLKHLIAYKNRWTKAPGEDSPLVKGTLWHLVMETHYGVIMKWQKDHGGVAVALKDEKAVLALALDAVKPLLFAPKGEQTENQELIWWMYEGYVEMWGADRQWIVLAVEYKLAEYLPDPDTGADSEYVLKAKLDLIVMDVKTGKIWVIDHKSGANLPSQFDLEIDDQFGLYTWLMQHKGLKIMGSIHNAARTTRNLGDHPDPPKGKTPQPLTQRMGRTYLNRGDVECLNIARDAFAVAANAYPAEGMALPLYSSPDARQCGWKCDFKEVHLLARAGRPLEAALSERGFVQDFTRH